MAESSPARRAATFRVFSATLACGRLIWGAGKLPFVRTPAVGRMLGKDCRGGREGAGEEEETREQGVLLEADAELDRNTVWVRFLSSPHPSLAKIRGRSRRKGARASTSCVAGRPRASLTSQEDGWQKPLHSPRDLALKDEATRLRSRGP